MTSTVVLVDQDFRVKIYRSRMDEHQCSTLFAQRYQTEAANLVATDLSLGLLDLRHIKGDAG